MEEVVTYSRDYATQSTIVDTTLEQQTSDHVDTTPKQQTVNTPVNFNDLNKDEIFCVLQFLDVRGVLAMSATCKKLYTISSK